MLVGFFEGCWLVWLHVSSRFALSVFSCCLFGCVVASSVFGDLLCTAVSGASHGLPLTMHLFPLLTSRLRIMDTKAHAYLSAIQIRIGGDHLPIICGHCTSNVAVQVGWRQEQICSEEFLYDQCTPGLYLRHSGLIVWLVFTLSQELFAVAPSSCAI